MGDTVSRSKCLLCWASEDSLTRGKLRDALAVKNERLGEALDSLEQAGRVCRTPAGFQRLD